MLNHRESAPTIPRAPDEEVDDNYPIDITAQGSLRVHESAFLEDQTVLKGRERLPSLLHACEADARRCGSNRATELGTPIGWGGLHFALGLLDFQGDVQASSASGKACAKPHTQPSSWPAASRLRCDDLNVEADIRIRRSGSVFI